MLAGYLEWTFPRLKVVIHSPKPFDDGQSSAKVVNCTELLLAAKPNSLQSPRCGSLMDQTHAVGSGRSGIS